MQLGNTSVEHTIYIYATLCTYKTDIKTILAVIKLKNINFILFVIHKCINTIVMASQLLYSCTCRSVQLNALLAYCRATDTTGAMKLNRKTTNKTTFNSYRYNYLNMHKGLLRTNALKYCGAFTELMKK